MKGARTRSQRPRGFTLLEVLVALVLSVLLVSAVYAGLNMYWRYSVAGRDEVERAQLARAVILKIQLDLRSVVYQAQSSSSSGQSSGSSGGQSGSSGSSGGSSSGSSSGSSTGSGSSSQSTDQQLTSPDTAATSTQSGLYGNATMLLIHVSRPSREVSAMLAGSNANTTSRTSDQAVVAWFVAGSGTGVLQSATGAQGLARLEGDRFAMSQADSQANVSAMAQQIEIVAPEIVGLKFTYFDGFNWRPDWDSSVLGGLPKAVEVLVEQSAGSGASTIHRMVIPLALAKPIDTSTVQ